jgi:hypothetical protein
MKGYPKPFIPFLVSVLITLLLTGVLLTPTTLTFRLAWEVAWRLEGDHRVWITAVHTMLSFIMLMTFGALWPAHIRAGWRMKANLISGVAMSIVIMILALSGLGILYAGGESFSVIAAVSHLVLGYLLIFCFPYHFVVGRRLHRKRIHHTT